MNNLCAWSERPFKTIKWQTTRHILSTFKRLPNKRSNGSAPAKTSSRLVFGEDECGGRLRDCIVCQLLQHLTLDRLKLRSRCWSGAKVPLIAIATHSNNNYGAAFFTSEGRHPHFLIELKGHRVYTSDWSRFSTVQHVWHAVN